MDKFNQAIVDETTGINGYPLSAWRRLVEMGNKPKQMAESAYSFYKGLGQQSLMPAQALQIMSPDLRQGVPQEALAADQDLNSEEFKRRQLIQRGLLGNGL